MKLHPYLRRKKSHSREGGYVLMVMMLFFALLAISLTAVAPAIVQRIRRQQEIELVHRGQQYARAIRLYYRKFGRYPLSLDDLENTNNLRFLRRRFKDPMTPGGDWRLIHYGEAQLTLPTAAPVLPGATVLGGGAAAGVAGASSPASSPFANTFSLSSQSGTAQPSTTPGQSSTPGQGGTQSASADSSQASQSGQPGQPGQPGTPVSQLSSPLGGPTIGGGPIVGVASTSKKESIKELNQKNHYNDWEFVYDPRLDLSFGQLPPTQPTQLPPGTGAPGVPVNPPGGQINPGGPGMQMPPGPGVQPPPTPPR